MKDIPHESFNNVEVSGDGHYVDGTDASMYDPTGMELLENEGSVDSSDEAAGTPDAACALDRPGPNADPLIESFMEHADLKTAVKVRVPAVCSDEMGVWKQGNEYLRPELKGLGHVAMGVVDYALTNYQKPADTTDLYATIVTESRASSFGFESPTLQTTEGTRGDQFEARFALTQDGVKVMHLGQAVTRAVRGVDNLLESGKVTWTEHDANYETYIGGPLDPETTHVFNAAGEELYTKDGLPVSWLRVRARYDPTGTHVMGIAISSTLLNGEVRSATVAGDWLADQMQEHAVRATLTINSATVDEQGFAAETQPAHHDLLNELSDLLLRVKPVPPAE